jgi:heptosyltransferase-2
LKDLGIVDEVFEVKKGSRKSYQQVQAELKKREFQKIIVPHESLRTCFLVRGLKAQEKVGFKKFHTLFFYDHLVVKPRNFPDSLRQMALIQKFDSDLDHKLKSIDSSNFYKKSESGALSAPPTWASMKIERPALKEMPQYQIFENKYKKSLQSQKPLVAIFPGSVWATKRWTLQGFTELVKSLSLQHQVLLMGGPGEEGLCQKIQDEVSAAENLCGQTSLLESFFFLQHCQYVVGNDSASMHLASAAGVPVYAIFGPTVLSQGFRPWNERTVIIEKSLPCRPCGRHGHQTCPIGTHECMTGIKANEVLQAILKNSPSL